MILLIVILLSAVSEDLRTFRISNKLIRAGALAGLLYVGADCFAAGYAPLQVLFVLAVRLFGATGLLLLLLPFWRFRVIGGGDVKLLCVCALILGFDGGVNAFVYALLSSVPIAGILLIPGILPKMKENRVTENGMHRMHFTLPILAGVCLRMVLPDLIVLPF